MTAARSVLPKMADAATMTSTPAALASFDVCGFRPPSISSLVLSEIFSEIHFVFSSTSGMKDWPDLPGTTDITKTMSSWSR